MIEFNQIIQMIEFKEYPKQRYFMGEVLPKVMTNANKRTRININEVKMHNFQHQMIEITFNRF